LLWLNGPFGVGKSTVARLLHARRGGVVIETAGLGGVLGGLGTGETAAGVGLWLGKIAGALAQDSGGVVMLPMTVYRSGSVETVLGALAMGGTDVSHVVLTCHTAQLAARIHRGPFDDETKRSHLAQLTPSLAGLAFIAHDLEVDTTCRSAADVAEAVSQQLDERGWRDGGVPGAV
jgi:broad-specificity NMP kinase